MSLDIDIGEPAPAVTAESAASANEARIREIRERMSLIPEGRALLEHADRNGIRIQLQTYTDTTHGGFNPSFNGDRTVRISDSLPLTDQVVCAFHELRHSTQYMDTGQRLFAWHARFADPETRLLENRVLEADAHVHQVVAAVRLAEAGHPEYLDSVRRWVDGNPAMRASLDTLDRLPASTIADDAALHRALFTSVFRDGLPHYNGFFFEESAAVMDRMTPQQFGRELERARHAGGLLNDANIHAVARAGGTSYLDGISLADLKPEMMASLTPDERRLMQAAERVGSANSNLSQAEFDALRRDYAESVARVYSPAIPEEAATRSPPESRREATASTDMPEVSSRIMSADRIIERTPDGGHVMHVRPPNATMVEIGRTMDDLRALGLKPEAVNDPQHGLSVRLQGDDAVRMHVFAREQTARVSTPARVDVDLSGDDYARQPVTAIPMPEVSARVMGAERIIERTPDGGHVMHVRPPNATMLDIGRTMDDLRAMGLKPEAVNDAQHGLSVRLQGDDAVRMQVFAREQAARPNISATATTNTAARQPVQTAPAPPPPATVTAQSPTVQPATATTAATQPVKPPAGAQGSRFTAATANGHISRTQGRADVAVNIAAGQYTEAAVSATAQVALNPSTYRATANLTQSVAPVASALGHIGRRLPVIGAVVTAGFVAAEVGSYLWNGEYGRAGAATVAGGAEILGNTVGFGAGDAAREAVRAGVIATAGENYAVNRSGIGNVVQTASTLISRGDPAKIEAQQKELIEKDPVLPKTVTVGGKTVPLVEALRDPVFRKTFVENLEKADKKGEIDLKAQIGKIKEFDKLETSRLAAVSARAADATAPRDVSTPVPGMMPIGA
jgi:hypothetical protein